MNDGNLSRDWPPAVDIVNPNGDSLLVLTCEHASNHIPAEYQGLGLPDFDLARHIAWDIGAAAVTRELCRRLDCIGFLGGYSRLLIDLNRPLQASSSIPLRSEATDIEGNFGISDHERLRRARKIFHPFHEAVASHLDLRQRAGKPTLIVAIHSFTPEFHGQARPWHAGILFDRYADYAHVLIAALGRDDKLVVAANQPYVIDRCEDYTVPFHGEDRKIPAILVEIRQDLISNEKGIEEWKERLAVALTELASRCPDLP